LSYFLIATPFAQIISPKISNWLLKFGTSEVVDGVTVTYPRLLGMAGWQWVYIFWGIPALILGLVVLWYLTDKPRQAKWLTDEEKVALENELENERVLKSGRRKMTFGQAMAQPKVYLLALAYFCTVTCSYSIEFFMPSVIKAWYNMSLDSVTWWIILPPLGALAGQIIAGRSSDHFQERRWHAIVPILIGAVAVGCVPFTKGNIYMTIIVFTLVFAGFKSYMPAFWSLPNMFLVQTAAAGSIGFINSVGNLGGFLGPTFTGFLAKKTGSFDAGLHYLAGFMLLSASIIFILTRGMKTHDGAPQAAPKS
ncbi:MAG TPA: MFS transporter, partial [Prosthecobacter sp.]|nr:MFS transporter [Prosthecobacter sp.]